MVYASKCLTYNCNAGNDIYKYIFIVTLYQMLKFLILIMWYFNMWLMKKHVNILMVHEKLKKVSCVKYTNIKYIFICMTFTYKETY